jgi:hypothetical protein
MILLWLLTVIANVVMIAVKVNTDAIMEIGKGCISISLKLSHGLRMTKVVLTKTHPIKKVNKILAKGLSLL